MTWYEIIFYLLAIDSVFVNIVVMFGKNDVLNKYAFFRRYMPLTRGWALWYLVLVIFIGYLVMK